MSQPAAPGQSSLKDKVKMLALAPFSKRKPETAYELTRSGVLRLNPIIQGLGASLRGIRQKI
jgi:hypothetical protein